MAVNHVAVERERERERESYTFREEKYSFKKQSNTHTDSFKKLANDARFFIMAKNIKVAIS